MDYGIVRPDVHALATTSTPTHSSLGEVRIRPTASYIAANTLDQR